MRKAISLLGALVLAALPLAASATEPTVAYLDAMGRATGNDRPAAVRAGEAIFRAEWPVQVLQVGANAAGGHLVLSLRLSGVHFHRPVSRDDFNAEVSTLVAQAFAAVPNAEEVDLWTSIPIPVPKHAIVAGDLAVPTWRTVFTVTVRRNESQSALVERLRSGRDLYVDEDWAHAAFKKTA